jgi:hypothetical protein
MGCRLNGFDTRQGQETGSGAHPASSPVGTRDTFPQNKVVGVFSHVVNLLSVRGWCKTIETEKKPSEGHCNLTVRIHFRMMSYC